LRGDPPAPGKRYIMCDTIVSTPRMSAGGCMILGKNSDREPNEAQNITFLPAMTHPSKSLVRCTYISIPQVEHTHALLLSRPFWMFGGEMGVNEFGVAIGNEAVFTRDPYYKKNDALLGMDMLRLALERATTAREAMALIIEFLQVHGQGGVHTFGGTKYYHNSFLIADAEESFILESSGKHWAMKQVYDIASISNCLTIGDDYDETSPGLEEYARVKGYTGRGKNFNFQRDFADPLYTRFAKGNIRAQCSYERMHGKKREITALDMMHILRDHNTAGEFHPGEKPMERICLHAGGLISTQTTGSMVAVMKRGYPPLIYLTGTAAPCMSMFKPHVLIKKQEKYKKNVFSSSYGDSGIDLYGSATNRFDEHTLWWTGERIHRRVLMKFNSLMAKISGTRDAYEKKMVHGVERLWLGKNEKELQETCAGYGASMIDETCKVADEIQKEYDDASIRREAPLWLLMQWRLHNMKAHIKI
jgi:secernin